MAGTFLPYGRQSIDDDDIAAVAKSLRANFITSGPLVDKYEAAFSVATGATHAVACNSGTAALHLAALAADLSPGQAAIVPALTFLATANVVRMTGAEVVFADTDPDTGLMTANTFAAALQRADAAGRKVTVAFPVHLNGQLCDMPALARLATARGITLIEDACHSLGVRGIANTTHSSMACFSTHPVKAITTGEGGVVATASEAAANRMRRLRSHGVTRTAETFINRELAFDDGVLNPWYYEMHEIGWNYRIPDMLCALGISQLNKLDDFHHRRAQIAALYDRKLSRLAPAIRPIPHDNARHGWHLYVILIDFSLIRMTRARFIAELLARGIGSQVHYVPLHRQPYYHDRYGVLSLPGADAYYARCLSIPCFPNLTDADVNQVVDALEQVACLMPNGSRSRIGEC